MSLRTYVLSALGHFMDNGKIPYIPVFQMSPAYFKNRTSPGTRQRKRRKKARRVGHV